MSGHLRCRQRLLGEEFGLRGRKLLVGEQALGLQRTQPLEFIDQPNLGVL
jgi:hypothetical protein